MISDTVVFVEDIERSQVLELWVRFQGFGEYEGVSSRDGGCVNCGRFRTAENEGGRQGVLIWCHSPSQTTYVGADHWACRLEEVVQEVVDVIEGPITTLEECWSEVEVAVSG